MSSKESLNCNWKPVPVSARKIVLIIFSCIASVVLADQYTKYIIVQSLSLGEIIPVIDGIFNLTLTYNRGAAFGMLADLPDSTRVVLLSSITLLAVVVVLYFLVMDYYHDIVAQFALGAILGGAAGNVIDRARLGQVVDFLDFYYGSYHWPAFNIADSAICVGVAVLLFRKTAGSIAESRRKESETLPLESE